MGSLLRPVTNKMWLYLLLLSALILGGCNSRFDTNSRDDDDGPTPPPVEEDTVPPTADIAFPAYQAATDDVQVLVTGRAADESEITRVRINGIDAATSNGFANWSVTIPLQPGENQLVVETADEFSNIDPAAATLLITSNKPIIEPRDVVLDSTNDRVLVVDPGLNAVVAVSLSTGIQSVLSDNDTPNADNPFDNIRAITVDEVNNRALTIDGATKAIIAVDLSTGERTILSSEGIPDATLPLRNPFGLTVDATNNRALVTDSVRDAVVAVDLDTGARSILSNDFNPNGTNPLDDPRGIALDLANNRALVVDESLIAVVAVDLITGTRTVLSDNSTPNATVPSGKEVRGGLPRVAPKIL